MKIIKKFNSNIDDTYKYQLLTKDNKIIEACVIFFKNEVAPINICISSQVGCSCNCTFCATGYKRFVRNLSYEEIIEQVSLVISEIPQFNNSLFEITYMGTGEPFNNFDAVLESIKSFECIYLNLSRVNISTIIPHLNIMKESLLSTRIPIHFQYSLHFVDDELRHKYFNNKLVPITKALDFLNTISTQTKEPFCINYLLFNDINDSTEDAYKLIKLTEALQAYIKISKYCPINYSALKPSNNYKEFTAVLDDKKIRWKPFQSKGTDIKASCGHLLSDVDF